MTADEVALTKPGAAQMAFDATGIRALLHERILESGAVGLAAGVVDVEGARVDSTAGAAGPAGGVVDDETVFEIGSVTKLFTATLLADLVVGGHLDLSMSIAALLPTFVGVPERGRPMTLADLATHTSGLPRLPVNLASPDPNDFAAFDVDALYAFLSSYRLPRDVGSQYEYSNAGYALLGHILELRENEPLDQLVRRRLLQPLGMTATAYVVPTTRALNRATPHDERLHPVAAVDVPLLGGAGGLHSTLPDMLRFAAAAIARNNGVLHAAFSLAKAPRFEISPERQVGLGWHTRLLVDHTVAWHSGETPGSRAAVVADDPHGVASVVLSNCALAIEDLALHLADPRAALTPPGAADARELSAEDLDRYVGVYEIHDGGTVTITRDRDGLVGAATGLGSAPLYARTETDFFVRVIPVTIHFEIDKGGDVVGLVLHDPGSPSTGRLASRIT